MSATMTTDPRLSRFSPLSRILCYDDFDEGLNGWCPLIGNYENSLDTILPEYRDLRPPMLSNLTMWDRHDWLDGGELCPEAGDATRTRQPRRRH